MAVFVDLVHDAAIAGAEARVVTRSLDQLDPRTYRHTRTNAGGEKSGSLRVHTRHIGFCDRTLYPPPKEGHGRTHQRIGEVASGRRIAPNSTA